MNKKISMGLLLGCFGYIYNANAALDSAQIILSGKVIANTCTFDSASSDVNPVLPNISDKDIRGIGMVGGNKSIRIVLKDCGSDVNKVEISASGQSDSENKMAFKNMSQSIPAKGVGIYRYQNEHGDEKFDPAGQIKQVYSLSKNQDTNLIFKAAYVGLSDSPTAGNIQSIITLTMKYL